MTYVTHLFNEFFGRRINESIRSWRQARVDAAELIWDRPERRWKRRDATPRWEGETAGIDT